jgi:hypothetical protein
VHSRSKGLNHPTWLANSCYTGHGRALLPSIGPDGGRPARNNARRATRPLLGKQQRRNRLIDAPRCASACRRPRAQRDIPGDRDAATKKFTPRFVRFFFPSATTGIAIHRAAPQLLASSPQGFRAKSGTYVGLDPSTKPRALASASTTTTQTLQQTLACSTATGWSISRRPPSSSLTWPRIGYASPTN